MGKKDRQSMEELWSKRFDEEAELNEEEPLSRKAKREREKSISPILTVTLIFMALLIILPTSAYLWWSSRDGVSEELSEPSVEQVAENNQTEDEGEEEPEESESQESDTVAEAEEDDSESEETQEAEEVTEETSEAPAGSADSDESIPASDNGETESLVEEQNQQASSESAGTESSETEFETEETVQEPASSQAVATYTVKAGDNMYRIALNHGMTTEELMQLNNIQDQNVYVGQELRVE